MNKYIQTLTLSMLLIMPVMAGAQGLAQGQTGAFGAFILGLTNLINNFLIPLLIALAVLAFIYGVFKYFIMGSDDEANREAGRSLMLYAIIGFVAIVALWAVVTFVADAFGFDSGIGPIQGPTGPTGGA